MHEASLAKNLLDQVRNIQREHPLSRVVDVEIELGPLSGVEPMLLSMAFERLVAEEGTGEIELIMREVALQAICEDCQRQCTISDFNFACLHCQSTKLEISQGDCVRLMSVNLTPIELCEGSVQCN